MANRTKPRRCKLCGKEIELTFEHVPPEKAFNNSAVRKYDSNESLKLLTGEDGRRPWDFEGLNNEINQRGSGDYYLCSQCNSNTGSWYISEYTKFASIMHTAIQKENFVVGDFYSIKLLEKFYPLRFFKAIMTMFCDINNDCFGDDQLRQFLLNKDSMDFDGDKYKVYIYLVAQGLQRIVPYSIMMIEGAGIIHCTEIAKYPLGMILYINKPSTYKPKAVCINDCIKFSYDSEAKLELNGIPYYEINNPMIVADFRSKEKIEEDIERIE